MSATETITLRTEDGVRLHALHVPGPDVGFAIVLVPGFTGHVGVPRVRRLADRLARVAPVLAIDPRGHGRSGGLSTVTEYEAHDVAAAVRWARRFVAPAVATVGFSLGGSTVIAHAALGPDRPDAVVAVSSVSRWHFTDTAPMRRVHWLIQTRLGRLTSRTLLKTRIERGWHVQPQAPAVLVGRIAAPLLIVHGDSDPYFPLSEGRLLAAAAPGAELWEESGFGHAENAATPELADRIGGWTARALARSHP